MRPSAGPPPAHVENRTLYQVKTLRHNTLNGATQPITPWSDRPTRVTLTTDATVTTTGQTRRPCRTVSRQYRPRHPATAQWSRDSMCGTGPPVTCAGSRTQA